MPVQTKLIKAFQLEKPTIVSGESVLVTVKPLDPKNVFNVIINGCRGYSQYVRFNAPGKRKIHVLVYNNQNDYERLVLPVEVLKRTDGLFLPSIVIRRNAYNPTLFSFTLKPHKKSRIPTTGITWELNGEESKLSRSTISFDLKGKLRNDLPHTTMHIAATLQIGGKPVTLKKSFTVINPYFILKQKQIINPTTRYDFTPTKMVDRTWQASVLVENVEEVAIRFTSETIYFFGRDGWIPSRRILSRPIDFTVPAKTGKPYASKLAMAALPRTALGYAVYLTGSVGRTRLLAQAYFEIPERYDLLKASLVVDKKFTQLLDKVSATTSGLRHKILTDEDLFSGSEKLQLQSHIGKLNLSIGSIQRIRDVEHLGNEEKGLKGESDWVGKECLPDELPPLENLVCQLTEEEKWVYIPARVINARKGDAVLSAASGGLIDGMFSVLTPAQYYTHSGIMSDNYYHIRHSTGCEEWLANQLANSGLDGLEPNALKYIWPGTITQTVEAAYKGEEMEDPNGKKEAGSVITYNISGFTEAKKFTGNDEFIDPLVLKPDPIFEADNPSVRTMLHQIADAAKTIKGHYRFFIYTDAKYALEEFTEKNAPEIKGWWASGTKPTVCSVLIWAAVKKALKNPTLQLEGPNGFLSSADLEPTDEGAKVDADTRDGLYLYSQSERQAAGEFIYDTFCEMVWNSVEGFESLIGAFDDAADDMGNQICNTFASDWSGEQTIPLEGGIPGSITMHSKDSDKWRTPGVGRALSPDDILNYWDKMKIDGNIVSGLYGFPEKLIYRPGYYEKRKVSKWALVDNSKKPATLTVTVTYNKENQGGAVVLAGGKDVLTNSLGKATLQLFQGNYTIIARKQIGGKECEAEKSFQAIGGQAAAISLQLQDPPTEKRRVAIHGSIEMTDAAGPMHASNIEEIKTFPFSVVAHVNPNQDEDSFSIIKKMGGEIRVESYWTVTWKNDFSVRVTVKVKFYEGTTEDTDDLEHQFTKTWDVEEDGVKKVSFKAWNVEEDELFDRAIFNVTIENEVAP